MIRGLEKTSCAKYGIMHRNTVINSKKLLDNTYNMKKDKKIFFAGQITGVEGYVESISSGLVAGINACILFDIYNEKEKNEDISEMYNMRKEAFSEYNVIGALAKYISTENDKFQPMNANFGILPELDEKIKDKKERYKKISDRALEKIKENKNSKNIDL